MGEMGTGEIGVRLRLPEWQCDQCILQWTYTAGNSWGVGQDGVGGLGLGPTATTRFPIVRLHSVLATKPRPPWFQLPLHHLKVLHLPPLVHQGGAAASQLESNPLQ